jgi:hypothetical protein
LTISLSGNFFFKLNFLNTPDILSSGMSYQNYSLVSVPRRLVLFLIFLFLLFRNLASSTLLLTRDICIRFSYRKFFLKKFTIQKAPMAHRQWSQEQYGVRGFFFKVLLLPLTQRNAFSICESSIDFRRLSLLLGSSQQPLSLFFRSSESKSVSFLSMFYLISMTSSLLANSFSSLLPPKLAKFSLTNLNGFLR